MATLIGQEAKPGVGMAPSLIRVATFLVVKYYAFFIVLAFIGDRFQNYVVLNSGDGSELLWNGLSYVLYISWAVVLLSLVLWLPFYVVLKIRSRVVQWLSLFVLLLAEFGLYTWTASPSDLLNGFYNAVITTVFILLFFRSTVANNWIAKPLSSRGQTTCNGGDQ